MNKWTCLAGLGAVAYIAAAPAYAQQTFADVPENHWAYQAVKELAEKGYVLGYPDGRFLGKRTMTRYEFATVLKRVLDKLAQTPTPTSTPTPPAAELTKADLDAIRKMIEEFKVELTVIGTDLKAVKEQLEGIEQRITDLESGVKDAKDLGVANQKAIDTINKKRLDGYIQGRYTRRATDSPTDAPENVAQDTSRGNTGNRDIFQIRRARLNIRGDVTDRAAYRIQLDARTAPTNGAAEVNVKEAYVVAKNFPLQLKTKGGAVPAITMDTWLGQSVVPFGHYLVYSSGDRAAPERYLAFSDTGSGLFPNQDYDKGVALRGKLFNHYNYHVGLYNGNGVASNDLGRRKDFIGQIGIPLIPNRWNVGISGYDGEGSTTGTTDPTGGLIGTGSTAVWTNRQRVKSLFGVDTQYVLPFGELKLEYVQGKGGLTGSAANTVPAAMRSYVDAASVQGAYGELGVNFGNVPKADVSDPVQPRVRFFTAYEYFNRNSDPADSGPFSTFAGEKVEAEDFVEERFHVGAHYFIDRSLRLRLWYEVPTNFPNTPAGVESVKRIGFYTAEIQVKF